MKTIKIFHAFNKNTLLLDVTNLRFVSIDTTSTDIFDVEAEFKDYEKFQQTLAYKQCQWSFSEYSESVVNSFFKKILDFKLKNDNPNGMNLKYYYGSEKLAEFQIPPAFFARLDLIVKKKL